MWVFAIATAVAEQQQWYQLYDAAIVHVRRREWKDAEDKLQEAVRVNPNSGRNVQQGRSRDDYFPEFYLGIVYLNTGRPDLALAEFGKARKRNLNVRDREFREIATYETDAQAQVTKRNAEASAAAAAAAKERAQRFANLMSRAEALYAQRDYAAADTTAREARDLGLDRQAPDQLIEKIAVARYIERIELALKRRDAPGARRELDAFAHAAPNAVPMELPERVAVLERELRRASFERDAMRAFYNGSYQQALSFLESGEKVAPLSARGTFYRACSLAAVFAAGGETNSRALADARRYFAEATKEAGDFERDRRYISPKILQLLRAQ
jgi:hypothetical protein